MFESPAFVPKKALFCPVVFELPALTPTNVLRFPAMLKTRVPPMLNCVIALRMFAPKLPAIFKLPGT